MFLPSDLTLLNGFAILFPFICWAVYAPLLRVSGRGTLTTQLHVVRIKWIATLLSTPRDNRTFDSMILGHISNSMSFFGSATLLVLAGLLGTLANIHHVYVGLADVRFIHRVSFELFTIHFSVLTLIMAISFFDFMYAIRKLAYTLAMVAALQRQPILELDKRSTILVTQTATVLSEAIKSLNNGVRGFYFAVAALFLFIGPWQAIFMSFALSLLLLYRQSRSKTAKAIETYVDAMNLPLERL